jgi:hypothetical protein
LVLKVMSQVSEELQLNRFDRIVIHRGGLDILDLVLKGNKGGLSAYVEINDYRRKFAC